jgi:hypothetical protein
MWAVLSCMVMYRYRVALYGHVSGQCCLVWSCIGAELPCMVMYLGSVVLYGNVSLTCIRALLCGLVMYQCSVLLLGKDVMPGKVSCKPHLGISIAHAHPCANLGHHRVSTFMWSSVLCCYYNSMQCSVLVPMCCAQVMWWAVLCMPDVGNGDKSKESIAVLCLLYCRVNCVVLLLTCVVSYVALCCHVVASVAMLSASSV